jgi:outer membrane protein insertion porin family
MELLFPLPFVKDQRSLRSALFIDVGNVFDTTCGDLQVACFNFDASELRYSAGIGLTWITGFGPLSFSLAKPLNDGDFDETEVFQFSLGQFF